MHISSFYHGWTVNDFHSCMHIPLYCVILFKITHLGICEIRYLSNFNSSPTQASFHQWCLCVTRCVIKLSQYFCAIVKMLKCPQENMLCLIHVKLFDACWVAVRWHWLLRLWGFHTNAFSWPLFTCLVYHSQIRGSEGVQICILREQRCELEDIKLFHLFNLFYFRILQVVDQSIHWRWD